MNLLNTDRLADNFFVILSNKVLGGLFGALVLAMAAAFFVLFLLDISGIYPWGNLDIENFKINIVNII